MKILQTLLEQWKANQEQKRAIAAERWEQEKRWREEDREEKRRAAAEEERRLQQKAQETAAEEERRRETYSILYRSHRQVLQKAATISYVSLTCHEDTWTFLARRSFGCWSPEWTTSVKGEEEGPGFVHES